MWTPGKVSKKRPHAGAVATKRGKWSHSSPAPTRRGRSGVRPQDALHQEVSGVERKTVDQLATNVSPVPVAGSLTLLNGCAQGTDYTQRIGRKTVNRSVYLRATIFPTEGTAPLGDIVRILVILDKEPNGAAPVVADVLTSAAPEAPMNLNNRDRFVTISDQIVECEAGNWSAGNLTTGAPKTHYVSFFKPIKCETIWGGTGATIASIQSNAIYMLLVSSNGVYQMQYSTRVRFEDE